jgi:hypothetical protein
MRDATARALRAEEYEQRFLRAVEAPVGEVGLLDEPRRRDVDSRRRRDVDASRRREAPAWDEPHRREPRPRAYGSRPSGAAVASSHGAGVPGRRTVSITGQAAPPRRRSSPAAAGFAARPDRAALWAFVLALFMVLMAVATAHAGV